MKLNAEANYTLGIMLSKILFDFYKDVKILSCSLNDTGVVVQFKTTSKVSSNDFSKIQKKIEKLRDRSIGVKIDKADKKKLLKIFDDDYQIEYIKDNDNLFLVTLDDFKMYIDVDSVFDNVSRVKNFLLDNVGSIYWQGDFKNKRVNVLYATGFSSRDELTEYEIWKKEVHERDHRKIGQQLEIFSINNLSGLGMPLWLPNGGLIKHLISTCINDLRIKYDFQFVSSPVLGNVELFKISGHWYHYKNDMFPPIKLEREELVLRPMTCPHHCLIYKSKPRHEKELPLRFTEDSILHRKEASGGLIGLERVRSMELLDTHIFCRQDQILSEISNCYHMINDALEAFGLSFFRIDLSLHDPLDKEKYIDNSELWKSSESQLRDALNLLNVKYEEKKGEAAFYGPKIDFQCKTALGKIITISTIQLDFSLPSSFDLNYYSENNVLQTPVLIHLGIIGTFERFISILLEQTKGVLPFWLMPKQIRIIPVNNIAHANACEKILAIFKENGIRADIDSREERLSKKIRDAQVLKIPFQVVIGEKEANNLNVINYRKYGSADTISVNTDDFIKELNKINSWKRK